MCNSFNKKFLDEASKHWSDSQKSEEDLRRSINASDADFMKKAVELALKGVDNNEGGPFGCIIVKDGKIIGRGNNQVTSKMDPTAHAEIQAIRQACAYLGDHQLEGCVMYTSCEPCPMCLGVIYWARPDRVYFGATREDAARSGFDDAYIYEEIGRQPEERKIEFVPLGREEALKAFSRWNDKEDKIQY